MRHGACQAGPWAVPAASHSQLPAASCCPWAAERASVVRGGILHPFPSAWLAYWQMKGHLHSEGKEWWCALANRAMTHLLARESQQKLPRSWLLLSALPQTYFCNIKQSPSTFLSLLCKLRKSKHLPLEHQFGGMKWEKQSAASWEPQLCAITCFRWGWIGKYPEDTSNFCHSVNQSFCVRVALSSRRMLKWFLVMLCWGGIIPQSHVFQHLLTPEDGPQTQFVLGGIQH